jgi:transposase
VDSGQGRASAARTLGVVEQTLLNWVKAHRGRTLKGASGKAQVSAEQMEISRLRAKLARVTMERGILGKAMAHFAKGQKRSMPLFNVTGEAGRSVCSAGCSV